MKSKLLCILHRSPPRHGAAKVGDFIGDSINLQKEYECKFITIKSSDTLSDIGKINLKKIYLVLELYVRVFFALVSFRPKKIYYTSSVNGAAFYRDVFISTLWKIYATIAKIDVFHHYHTKGIDKFISKSKLNFMLTNFFLKDANLVLLSPLLKKDFDKIKTYKKVLYLPNGIENHLSDIEFESYISEKDFGDIHILYLSNMIKSKGYFAVLELAKKIKNKKYIFHFAGGWQNREDEAEFFNFIEINHLKDMVVFHGFVDGVKKDKLFKQASIFIFPTKYENEAFPLSILEAFSYGIPAVSTNEGSIPSIIDEKSGLVVEDLDFLSEAVDDALGMFANINTARYCRKRYLDNFSLEIFEKRLVKIFKF